MRTQTIDLVPATLSAVSFLLSSTAVPLTDAVPSPLPAWTPPKQRVRGASTQLRLILVPPDQEPFGCFKHPSVPLARLLCCNERHRGEQLQIEGGVFRGPLGGFKPLRQVFDSPPGVGALPTGYRREHRPTGYE